MAEQWISARQAFDLVQDEEALLGRLRSGLLNARARVIQSDNERVENQNVAPHFWVEDPLVDFRQDWETGDFSNCINGSTDEEIFGVTIGLTGLLEMLPIEKRGLATIKLSVAGNPEWISSHEARLLYYQTSMAVTKVDEWLIEQARIGFAVARAVLAQCGHGNTSAGWIWEEREWDVPTWFWENFPESRNCTMDLNVGRISGTGMSPQGRVSIALSGLHFHRTTIIALLNGPSEPVEIARTAEAEDDIKRGRRFQYDWPLAISSVWGKLYRGELMPERQADIELALIAELRNGDKEPSLSTVRPFAKPIFDEFSKP